MTVHRVIFEWYSITKRVTALGKRLDKPYGEYRRPAHVSHFIYKDITSKTDMKELKKNNKIALQLKDRCFEKWFVLIKNGIVAFN